MTELKQQYIIDQLNLDGLPPPNVFTHSNFEDQIENEGFTLPFRPKYDNLVKAIRDRLPNTKITPFAVSKVDYDIACFVVSGNKRGYVVQFQDFVPSGQESPMYYRTVSDWLSGNREFCAGCQHQVHQGLG